MTYFIDKVPRSLSQVNKLRKMIVLEENGRSRGILADIKSFYLIQHMLTLLSSRCSKDCLTAYSETMQEGR